MGFSAGAMTALALGLKSQAQDRPAFIGGIYGPAVDVAPTSTAPPLFMALTVDDDLFPDNGFELARAWRRAGRPYEVHVYQAGGHGFGLDSPSNTTANWMDSFVRWLEFNKILKPGPSSAG